MRPIVGQTYRFRSDVPPYVTTPLYHGLEMTVDSVDNYRVTGYGPGAHGVTHGPGTYYGSTDKFFDRFEPLSRPEELINEEW